MSNLPLSYRVVGQDDYMLGIVVDASGHYRIDSGDYASHTPRTGTLSPPQIVELAALSQALGSPRDHPSPEGASGFMATLTLGEGTGERCWRFWEGALAEDPALERLVRFLEVI